MTSVFRIHGPFQIPVEQLARGRHIPKNLDEFWDDVGDIKPRRGVYVFGIRAGQGITPWYVGKATRTFEQECFASHKRAAHYTPTILKYLRGTPVMFFAVYPKQVGPPNSKKIDELEKFLINVGSVKNEELTNILGRKKPTWGIAGVLRGGKGRHGEAPAQFRKSMGL